MFNITYRQARKDCTFLWSIAAAYNEDIDTRDLRELLFYPKRSKAKEIYIGQIKYWFAVGPDPADYDYEDLKTHKDHLYKIADRYSIPSWELVP